MNRAMRLRYAARTSGAWLYTFIRNGVDHMYKAVLFDLDGTLTDSGPGIMKCVQYALEKIGRPEPDLEKLRVFVGPPMFRQFMDYAGVDEDTARQAVAFYRERYIPTGIFENSVYPGIPELLSFLKMKGYQVAVASSKPEFMVRTVLEHFDLISYFDEMVGATPDGSLIDKAEVIAEAMRRLGIPESHKNEVLMIGDTRFDVEGARRAGLDCVAVAFGYGEKKDLEAAEPLRIVDTVDELKDFFC